MVRQLRVDDVLGGTFCPTDGFVDPHSVMMGFMLKARERGVRLWLDTNVTSIEVNERQPSETGPATGSADVLPAFQGNGSNPRRVTGVMTSRGFVSAPVVVNAAGAWAAEVARLAGAALPVEPLRRQLVPTEPFDQISKRFPMVI